MTRGWIIQPLSHLLDKKCTEKTSILFPFKLNGIWSWWQFSFRFLTKWKAIWFKSKGNLSSRPYPIQFEREWNTTFFSVIVKPLVWFQMGSLSSHLFLCTAMLSRSFGSPPITIILVRDYCNLCRPNLPPRENKNNPILMGIYLWLISSPVLLGAQCIYHRI